MFTAMLFVDRYTVMINITYQLIVLDEMEGTT